jgi:hypothetical protein
MDENLSWEDGPSLDSHGVSIWLQEFICIDWSGRTAAKEIANLFNVPLDYALKQLGVEPN